MIYLITSIAAIAGFLFGYDEGIISGTLSTLINEFSLSTLLTGILTSALPIGALLGSIIVSVLLASRFSLVIGRRILLQVTASLFILGGMCIAINPTSLVIIFSRFALGLAIGLAAIVTPLYISETAPARIRGKLVTIYQLAITIGILVSYVMNHFLIETISWRWIYATVILPAVLLLIGVIGLPESPRWLVLIGKIEQARRILQRLRREESIQETEKELTGIVDSVRSEQPTSWHEIALPQHRALLIVGAFLFILQQVSGINAIIYYAPIIFKETGFESLSSQILATLGIGTVNCLTTIFAMFLVEKWGRYRLLLLGFAGTTVSLGSIWLGSYLQYSQMHWLSFYALLFYIFSFAISLGPLPHVIMSEIFPLNIRGAGMGLSSAMNWTFNAIVVFIFPVLLAMMGMPNTFGLFGLMCFIGFLFTYWYVPETKGLSLEYIEQYVNKGQPLRKLGRSQPPFIPVTGKLTLTDSCDTKEIS